MTKQTRLSNLSFVLLAIVILLCANWLWQSDNQVDQMEYSQVRQLFLQEKVVFQWNTGPLLQWAFRNIFPPRPAWQPTGPPCPPPA